MNLLKVEFVNREEDSHNSSSVEWVVVINLVWNKEIDWLQIIIVHIVGIKKSNEKNDNLCSKLRLQIRRKGLDILKVGLILFFFIFLQLIFWQGLVVDVNLYINSHEHITNTFKSDNVSRISMFYIFAFLS